jgi:hypothetical protein
VLGAVTGLGLLIAGFVGIIVLVAALLLIAVRGPRLLATSGLLTGAGLVLSVLFARVGLDCTVFVAPGEGCEAADIWVWVGGSVVLFVVGLVGSALAFKRTRP